MQSTKVREDLHVYRICSESVPSVGQDRQILTCLRSGDRKLQALRGAIRNKFCRARSPDPDPLIPVARGPVPHKTFTNPVGAVSNRAYRWRVPVASKAFTRFYRSRSPDLDLFAIRRSQTTDVNWVYSRCAAPKPRSSCSSCPSCPSCFRQQKNAPPRVATPLQVR